MPPFDTGPVTEPFAGLARDYPGAGVYPARDFRIEWGPIFHRGRLDGSARVLVVGQDPGQHESIAHRILVGEAGQRAQGFLRKLGIDRSYVMVNCYLYSVYGQAAGERHADDPEIAAYRHRWLDALFDASQIEAVISFGHLGRQAFERWRQTPRGQAVNPHFEPLVHPTMPEAASKGDENKRRELTRDMLQNWNRALERLHSAITAPDVQRPLDLYGDDLRPRDRARIPSDDLPAGAPVWWSSVKQWAARRAVGSFNDRTAEAEAKRATIVVTVPAGERPWHEH